MKRVTCLHFQIYIYTHTHTNVIMFKRCCHCGKHLFHRDIYFRGDVNAYCSEYCRDQSLLYTMHTPNDDEFDVGLDMSQLWDSVVDIDVPRPVQLDVSSCFDPTVDSVPDLAPTFTDNVVTKQPQIHKFDSAHIDTIRNEKRKKSICVCPMHSCDVQCYNVEELLMSRKRKWFFDKVWG